MAAASANRDIIAVGASAGGVKALQRLVRDLPASLPAAVFIVLHIGRSETQLAISGTLTPPRRCWRKRNGPRSFWRGWCGLTATAPNLCGAWQSGKICDKIANSPSAS